MSKNKFIRSEFWKYHHDIHKIKNHDLTKDLFTKALKQRNTRTILYRVFERLYVLRNQLMHGATTWGRTLGKDQLTDGTEIMHWLLPIFIEIMLETSEDKWHLWGRVWYPRVENVDIEGKPASQTF